MSQYNVTVAVTASIPQPILAPEDLGDKTPPYIQEDYPSLQDMLDPQSRPPSSGIVRANSFFYQSLIREMSGNSLVLPYKDKTGEKDSVSRGYYSPLSSETQKYMAIGNDFVAQLKKTLSAISTEASLKEDSRDVVTRDPIEQSPILEMEPKKSSKDESLKQSSIDLTTNESSRKRPRTPSPEEESREPAVKSSRVSTTEYEQEDITNEGSRNPPVSQNMSENQAKESDISPQAMESENQSDENEKMQSEKQSEMSGSEDTLESETVKAQEVSTFTSEKSVLEENTNEKPDTASQNVVLQQTPGTQPGLGRRCSVCHHIDCRRVLRLKAEEEAKTKKSALEEKSHEEPKTTSQNVVLQQTPGTQPGLGRRCSVCYHIDCRRVLRLKAEEEAKTKKSVLEKKSDEEAETASQNVVLQQTPGTQPGLGRRCSVCYHIDCRRVLRLKAQEKISKSKLQSRKLTPVKTPVKTPVTRSIGTRNLSSGWTKRISNHSPLHIRTLKARLFQAVENGDLVQVQKLMQDTGVTVRKGKSGCTLLHVAALHNQVDVVMFLLKWISPNITNILGQTPGHVAAERGHIQVVRILVKDLDFDPDRKDKRHNTMKTLLSGQLFGAVLEGDKKQIERLLSVGADPDSHGGNRVNKVLERELRVSTPRLLAEALNMDSVVTMFKKRSSDMKKSTDDYSRKLTKEEPMDLRVPVRQFNVIPSSTCKGGPDVYKMDKNTSGLVYLLNFSSFENRSDLHLPQVDYDGRLLSSVFDNMGYKCETHSSLTARQTKEVLKNIRDADALSEAGCVVFVISGYGVKDRHFLTSDLKSMSVEYLCSFFRDSDCPQLKNKPKLFLFNLCNTNKVNVSSISEGMSPKSVRFEEPLSDMACISMSSFDLECMSNSKGSVFSWALCRTLADHAHDKELGDLYREFLKQCITTSMSVVPELRYFGFTKKFFFNPMKNIVN